MSDAPYIRTPGDLVGLTPSEEAALRGAVGAFGFTPTNDLSRYSRTILPAVRDLLAAREHAATEKALLDAIHRIEFIAMPTVEITAARETDLFVLRDLLRIARGDA